jgi:hypothetical protein
VGTHDFRAFANRVEHTTKNLVEQGEGHTLDTMRTVDSVRLVDEGDGYFRIEFRLKSALYRMVAPKSLFLAIRFPPSPLFQAPVANPSLTDR